MTIEQKLCKDKKIQLQSMSNAITFINKGLQSRLNIATVQPQSKSAWPYFLELLKIQKKTPS